MNAVTANSTSTLEWKRNNVYVGDAFVGTVRHCYGGPKLGVWHGEEGRMHWMHIQSGDTVDDMLEGMLLRGVLEVIPDDADLNP